MTVEQATGRAVDDDRLNQADLVKDARQGMLLALWLDAPVGGMSEHLVGSFLAVANEAIRPRILLAVTWSPPQRDCAGCPMLAYPPA